MLEEPGGERRESDAGLIALAVAVGIPSLHLLIAYAPMFAGNVEDTGSPFMMIPGCGYVILQDFVLYQVTKKALLTNQPTWRRLGLVLGTAVLLDLTCVGLPIALTFTSSK